MVYEKTSNNMFLYEGQLKGRRRLVQFAYPRESRDLDSREEE